VHQTNPADACTFWSGCGAVRREIFLEIGGFNTAYERPAIEDIELGGRLYRAGYSIKLNRNIQVQHLKSLSVAQLVRSDICDRAIPWTRLLMENGGNIPQTLNLALRHRGSLVLTVILCLSFVAGCIQFRSTFAAPFLSLVLLFLSAYWVSFARDRTIDATLALGVWVMFVAWTARWHDLWLLICLPISAHLLLALRTAIVSRNSRRWRLSGMIVGFYILAVAGFLLSRAPWEWLTLAMFLSAAGVVVLNRDFYLFLANRWGKLYALSSVPFHILYQLYSGLGFVLGILLHFGARLNGRPAPKMEPNQVAVMTISGAPSERSSHAPTPMGPPARTQTAP
jgi:hypothetical protein